MNSTYGGNSFFLPGGDRAVLLVHGFTASTQEVEELAFTLADRGFTVSVPLLAGHNKDFSWFKKTDADDYFASVFESYEKLIGYKTVDVVGLSFGGTLILHLAAVRKVGKIVVLAPAIFYHSKAVWLSSFLSYIYRGRVMKKKEKNPKTGIVSRWDLFKPEAIIERIAYPWFAFPQLLSTMHLMEKVRKELHRIVNPVLILHSKLDTTARPDGSRYLFDNIGSKEKKLFWLKESGHIITVDYESETVKREILDFLGEIKKPPGEEA